MAMQPVTNINAPYDVITNQNTSFLTTAYDLWLLKEEETVLMVCGLW